MKNKTEYKVTPENIREYTTADIEFISQNSKLNKYGFPEILPTKTRLGKNVLITFYKAKIKSLDGEVLDEEEASFDICDNEIFDKNDELAESKIKFLSALFSLNRFVDGGVYYYGNFYTRKMTPKFAKYLTKKFMENYFHLEDIDLLYKFFDKMDGGFLPYFPQKSYKKDKKSIFSAYKATVSRLDGEKSDKEFSFHIFEGDTFDLSKEEDLEKAELINSLLNSDLVVKGFYLYGELVPEHIDGLLKDFLEKTFIRKNFVVEQRDYLFSHVKKDKLGQYPLYWPRKNKDNRKIAISVVNANVSLIGLDSEYSNFDVYVDEKFDLTQDVFKTKLNIIKSLLSKDDPLTGALYFDGVLVPGDLKRDEILRRKNTVEHELKIYIDDNDDFLRINNNFTIEDRFDLLRLTPLFDKYYPNNIDKIEAKDEEFTEDLFLRIKNVNIVSEFGKFQLDSDFSLDIKKTDNYSDIKSDELDLILKSLFNKNVKVRGAIYYNGKNISLRKAGFSQFMTELEGFLPKDKLTEFKEYGEKEFYQYYIDSKTGMLKYWPTHDKNGEEVLLSVVSADVFFGNARRVVKACNHLNFDIYLGETFGLVGESGSGKTTISRAILGINSLTNGAIYFKGKLITGKLTKREILQNKKNIQMIFQDPAASLNERANVDYIISEGLYNFKLFKTKEERLAKVNDMLKEVGLLPEHLSRYPHEFSGGQRQRIGIARALVIEPELVLADEPISALDVSIRAQVLNLLKKLQNERDLTYLFIAHDLSIIKYISDRIAVMHNGHIVELGNADEIYSNPVHPYTKALLTAIPQPDPRSKNKRQKLVYNKGDIDYDRCEWIALENNHYILATKELVEKWRK